MVSLKLDFASIFPQATRRNLFSSSSIVNFFIGLVNRLLENDNLDDITPAPIYHATPTIKSPPTSTRSIEESPLPTPPLWFCLLVVFIFMTLPFIRFFTRRPKPSPRLRSIPRPSPVPSRPSRLWRVLSSISKGKVIRTFLYAIILSQCAPTMVDAFMDAVTIKFPPYLALQPPSVGTIYRIHISIASGVFTVLIILVPHFVRAWKRDKLREAAETRRPSPSDVLETEDSDTSEDISSLRPHKDDSHVEHPDSNAMEPSPSTSDTLPIPTLASLSVFPSIPSHQTLSTWNSHTSVSILGSSTVDSETPCQRTSSISPRPFPSPSSTLPLRITYTLPSSPSLPSLRTVTASNSNESLRVGDHEVEDAMANDHLVDEYLDSFNASANRTLEWIEDQQSFFHAAADEDDFEINHNDNDEPGSEACDEDDSSSSLDSLDRFRHEMFGEANDSDLEASGDDNGNGNDSSSSICSLDVFRVHVAPEEEDDPEIDGDREEKEDWSETEIDAFEALIAAVDVVDDDESGEDLEEESGSPTLEAEGDHVPSADSDDLGDILIREDPTGHVEDDESDEDTDAYTSEEEEDSEDTLDSSTDSEENDSEIDGDREEEEEEEDWSETEINAFEGLLGDVHVVEDGESGEDLDEEVEEEASDSSTDSSEENDPEIDGDREEEEEEEEEEDWSEIEINAFEGLIADVHVSEDGGSGGDLRGQEEEDDDEEDEALGSSPDSEDLLAAEADESIKVHIPDVLKLEKDLTVDELEHEHGIVDALPGDIPIPARFDSGLSTDCDWSLVFEGVSFVEIEDGKTGKNELNKPLTVNDETSGLEEDMVMMIQGGTTTTPSTAAQSESTGDAVETITNFVDDDNQIGDSEIMHQEFLGDAVPVGDGDGDDGVSGEIYDVQAEVEDPFHYGEAGVAEVSQSLRHIEDQDINFVQASTSDFGIQGEAPCCDTGHHPETFIDADEEVHDLDVTIPISESRDPASILSSSSVDIPIPSWETLEDERERILLQQDPGYSGIGMSSISNTCQNLSNELKLQGEPLLGFDSSPSPIHTSPSLAAVYDSQSRILEGTDDTTGSPSKSSAPSASSDLPLTVTTVDSPSTSQTQPVKPKPKPKIRSSILGLLDSPKALRSARGSWR